MADEIPLEQAAAYFGVMPERIAKAAHQGLVQAALRGVQIIVTQIIPSRSPQPMDRGVFRAGWRIDVRGEAVYIENLEPHAALIEHGVRAVKVKVGAAMIRALAEWSMRKGFANTQPEAVRIAWAIAKKMQQRGIFRHNGHAGMHILGEFMDKHADKVVSEEVTRAIRVELSRG